MNYEPFTSIKNHLIIFNLSALIRVICGWSYSTLVEDSLQINPFYAKQTQFPKKSNDVNLYNTTKYERKRNWTLSENKPNSNPNKANLLKAKMNINSIITKDYRKKDDFEVRINKPNFRKAQNERKLICSKGLQKKNDFAVQKNKPNSNPISESYQKSAGSIFYSSKVQG